MGAPVWRASMELAEEEGDSFLFQSELTASPMEDKIPCKSQIKTVNAKGHETKM